MASEWYDYHELKDYLYKLWKGKVWDSLSQEIKRIYWNDLQKLRGEANADMELGGSDEEAFLCALQPDDEDDGKKAKKKRKKGNYLRAYSIERAMENGIDYPYSFTPEEYVIKSEQYEELYTALTTLDDFDRSIIEMYYFMGMNERQIGQELGVVQKTINNHKTNSLETMREILTKNQ